MGWNKTEKQPRSSREERNAYFQSIRQKVTFEKRKFDVKTLPADLHRVYKKLESDYGEEYALTTVFMIRTAIELHRAWHNTLLTAKILQQLKDAFRIRLAWELGVIRLKFHIEDGNHELVYKVPYDYDSEYQDLFMKIAVAYLDGHITVHQGLIYQSETKQGKHTAKSGLFIRDFPGRLVVYPLEAATCAVIFFGGDWVDFGVAAITGLASGLVEYLLSMIGGSAKLLTDVSVGISTGIIAGLFFDSNIANIGTQLCLPSIFLGTLYWFFYGTAFVLGVLEIISGELETGVVRFMAVSVKTFILSLGTSFGMQLVLDSPKEAWFDTIGNCDRIELSAQAWRIPLYLACSASALGQYRFPLVDYWRGLAVQLVGYEVQFQVFQALKERQNMDFLDTAAANTAAGIAAVVFASILQRLVDGLGYYYHARVLQRYQGNFSPFGEFIFKINQTYIRITNCLGLGKRNDLVFLKMTEKLKLQREELENPDHSRSEIGLTLEEEIVFLEAVIQAENLNIWALLMPTVYQLVPGSLIARLWFNIIFPPLLASEEKMLYQYINGTASFEPIDVVTRSQSGDVNIAANLLVVATSLALGLLIGFVLVEHGTILVKKILYRKSENEVSISDPNRTITKAASTRLKDDRNFFSHTINENNFNSVEAGLSDSSSDDKNATEKEVTFEETAPGM